MSTHSQLPSEADLHRVAEQLGRTPRGVVAISYRTPDGEPAVVMTVPRLPDGTPFPTLYYFDGTTSSGTGFPHGSVPSYEGHD